MTKTQLFSRDLRKKRSEISQLQEDLMDLKDHLLVIEARAKNAGVVTYSPDQVKSRLGLRKVARS